MGRLKETTPPANDPVSLAQVLAHLNLPSTVDSQTQTYLESLIKRAAQTFEIETCRAIITSTWLLALDEFPDDLIQIPRPPLQTVSSVKYYNSAGVLTTIDSSDYRVHTVGLFGEIEPVNSWPSPQSRRNAVEIVFVAGYGDESTDIPEALQHGILMLIAHWYANREMIATGTIVAPIPRTVQDVMNNYKAEV